MDTYSSRPFISHDGVDDDGHRAEVKVNTGYGLISRVESSGAGKSFKFNFSVSNSKYEPAGWAPEGSNVYDKLKEAEKRQEPIHFRIETRRKPNIDRREPIEELATLARAKDSIFKGVAAVRFEDEETWTVSPHAVTSMDEDPRGNGGGVFKASDMSDEDRKKNAPDAKTVYGGLEPPPYVTRLKSGAINPGSIAASVPLNLLAFVAEWDRDHDELSRAADRQVNVAKVLLGAANELQLAIFDGELKEPDLGAGSHTRARALLFETIRTYYPISQEIVASKESLMAWKDDLVKKSLGMWRWSLKEVEAIHQG